MAKSAKGATQVWTEPFKSILHNNGSGNNRWEFQEGEKQTILESQKIGEKVSAALKGDSGE